MQVKGTTNYTRIFHLHILYTLMLFFKNILHITYMYKPIYNINIVLCIPENILIL